LTDHLKIEKVEETKLCSS